MMQRTMTSNEKPLAPDNKSVAFNYEQFLNQPITSQILDIIVQNLNNYIAKPVSGFNLNDFKKLTLWYKNNKKSIDKKDKKFTAILSKAKFVYLLEKNQKKLDKFISGNKIDIHKIFTWFEKNKDNPDFLDRDKYPFIAKLTHALTIQAATLRKIDKQEASDIMKAVEQLINFIPREVKFSVNAPDREHLHATYQALAAEYERQLLSLPKNNEEERVKIRKEAGHAYFDMLRTAPHVEAFDHFTLIQKYKNDLPDSGICNAFTSEAIRFYQKNKQRGNTTFISKMTSKTAAEQKPVRFIERLAILQEHDVSANDAPRKKGLPTSLSSKELSFSPKSNSINFIEILLDLGITGSRKHSLELRISRDKSKNITEFHIIDATFGEAHFSNTENGLAEFEKTMKTLERGYSLIYGDVRYVTFNKQKALMENKMLLFKSSLKKEKPDLTFKDKIQRKHLRDSL